MNSNDGASILWAGKKTSSRQSNRQRGFNVLLKDNKIQMLGGLCGG
jgi:hypothetical protein